MRQRCPLVLVSLIALVVMVTFSRAGAQSFAVSADFDVELGANGFQGFILGSTLENRGYVVEVSPLEPGGTAVRAFVQEESNGLTWIDVVRITSLASAPILANIRIRATTTAPVLTDVSVVLQPEVLHKFSLGPSSANRGYVVEVSPFNATSNGEGIRASVQPEFNGGAWNDVVNVRLAGGAAGPVNANIRVYAVTTAPVVSTLNVTLQPGVLHKFPLGPSSANRGYVVEASPLSATASGAAVTAVAQPEFDGSAWNDVVNVQLLDAAGPVNANIRVYAITDVAVGSCGGSVPCACGNRLIDSRTLVNGVDPITTAICPGDGLIIEASLNLGGNTIRGSGTGAGIRVDLTNGLTVAGGRITGFGSAIDGEDMTGNHFTDLQLVGNIHAGISVAEANNNIVERIIVTRMECGLVGILVGGGSNEIRLNRVEFNRFGGVVPAGIHVSRQLGEPGGNTVSRNIVRQNTRCGPTPVAGLEISDDGATVELNRSEDNDGDGFVIARVDEGDPGVTVARNIALRNAENGFRVLAIDSRFDRNRASYNGRSAAGFGILDSTSGHGTEGTANTYVNNVCAGNGLGDADPPGLCR